MNTWLQKVVIDTVKYSQEKTNLLKFTKLKLIQKTHQSLLSESPGFVTLSNKYLGRDDSILMMIKVCDMPVFLKNWFSCHTPDKVEPFPDYTKEESKSLVIHSLRFPLNNHT